MQVKITNKIVGRHVKILFLSGLLQHTQNFLGFMLTTRAIFNNIICTCLESVKQTKKL